MQERLENYLRIWYKARCDLFHNADTSTTSWKEYSQWGYEIQKAIQAYYFIFLHVNGYLFGLNDVFPTKEQINEFWKKSLKREKREQEYDSIDEITRRFNIGSNLAETVQDFIVFYLDIVDEASIEEIILSSYPFGVNIAHYQTYITLLEYFLEEKILLKKDGKYIKNFENIDDFF